MAFVNKNTILNVIMMICMFNFVFLIGSLFIVQRFTGDTVLTGSIDRGETFTGSPNFIQNIDVTFSFGTRVSGGMSLSENLKITVRTPEGKEYSWIKSFSCNSDLDDSEGVSCGDYTMIFTPRSTGTYNIKISDAEFNTDIRLISGMVNPTKKGLVFVVPPVFSFIIMICVVKVFNHQISDLTIKQAFIAIMISLIITYVVVLYTST